MPEVSILMGVYNEQEYLAESISSILNQTSENFELIIIDDASKDNFSEIVQQFDDERIRLLENKTNLGLTKSLNRGLDLAAGKYIARQDADDISEPDRLERQVAFLEDNEEIALVVL